VIAVVLKDIDLAGTGQRPADILILFLHRRLIVPGAEQPPGREHAGFSIARQPETGRPLPFHELFAVFRADAASHVLRIRVLFAVLVEVVTGPFFSDVDDFEFKGAVTDFPRAVFPIGYIALGLVIHPDELVLPIVQVKSFKVVEEIYLPSISHILSVVAFFTAVFATEYQ